MSKEVLRDSNGNKLGEIETNGTRRILRDARYVTLGSYDSKDNTTRDRNGGRIGSGDQLTRLLS